RMAGATEVLLASNRRFALVHELRAEAEPPLPALLGKLAPVDLVLIEGYKNAPHPNLELHRAAAGMPLLALGDPAIVAIASDAAPRPAPVPVIGLDDVEAIVEILISRAVPLSAAFAGAGVA